MGTPFALNCSSRRPYSDFHSRFRAELEKLTVWPAPERYDELARLVPQAANVTLPSFVPENRDTVRSSGGYEQHVARLQAVPTRRESWHDFFNMSVWAHFPKVRWALNAIHVAADVGPKDPRNGRAPAQNLAATFDEAGMLVVSSSCAVLEELQELRFKRAFWDMRAEVVATTHFWVVGHGMLESLLQPHARLSARSLLLHVSNLPPNDSDQLRFELDATAAARIQGWRHGRNVLDPVPLLAIPGFSQNDSADFYDDPRNIRFDPISRRHRR